MPGAAGATPINVVSFHPTSVEQAPSATRRRQAAALRVSRQAASAYRSSFNSSLVSSRTSPRIQRAAVKAQVVDAGIGGEMVLEVGLVEAATA